MTKTCKNCGHDKKKHSFGPAVYCSGTLKLSCECKKFEAEDNSLLDNQKGSVKDFPNIPKKAVKGLINSLEDVKKGDYIVMEKGKPQKGCNVICSPLCLKHDIPNPCPACENHSPQSLSHLIEDGITGKGPDAKLQTGISETSGSYTLSDEIYKTGDEDVVHIVDIKKFIRRLKFEFRELYHVNKKIDKLSGSYLAGEELSK